MHSHFYPFQTFTAMYSHAEPFQPFLPFIDIFSHLQPFSVVPAMCSNFCRSGIVGIGIGIRITHFPISKNDVLGFNCSSTSHFTVVFCETDSVFLGADTQE